MKAFFKKWWHGLLALYTFIYMPCFLYLERHVTSETGFHAIHCALDDHLPFVEYFMSIAVIIYFVFPNGLADFRPETFPRDNFCTDLVKLLHKADTPTNVLPSLHVYNTLVIEFAVFNSKTFGRHKKKVCIITAIWGLLICVSTVFLKQHSVYDVLAAIVLAAIIYPITYKTKFFKKIQ